MSIQAKICGLKTEAAVRAAVEGGAAMVGFVFFEPSPRNITPDEAATLMALVPAGVQKVALLVDPDDELVRAVCALPVDVLQLHGNEMPARVTEIKALSNLPVIKAVGISTAEDVARAHAFEGVVDSLMFDGHAPAGASRPGGNAVAFDWTLLADKTWAVPWMVAGGLNADNVADAVRISGAEMVDVSSGVEDAPGVKNPSEISRFLGVVAAL